MKKTSILLVDDHAVVRMGLSAIINLQADLKVCGEAENGEAAVRLAAELKPDVVVMDFSLPGMDGAEATAAVLKASPSSKVLILTSFGTSADLARAMAAGAIEAVRNNTDYIAEDGTPSFLAYGVDGTAQGCLLIKEGLLTATALQNAGEIAALNMSYAEKVLNGEMEYTEVNDYVDAPEINAENVDEFIQIYIDNGELSADTLG